MVRAHIEPAGVLRRVRIAKARILGRNAQGVGRGVGAAECGKEAREGIGGRDWRGNWLLRLSGNGSGQNKS
jgi:hypothetical protein